MSEKQFHFNTTDNELTIREGNALDVAHPKGIKITGTLGAPYQFYEGKKSIIEPVKSHIQLKKDTGVITLYIEDTDQFSESVITGQLKKDAALEAWKINAEYNWTVQSFLKHIKKQAFYFSSKDELSAMIDSLQSWNAKVETVIQQHNANTGNSLSMLEKKVSDITLKTKFSLTIPIYQGYERQKFDVEIGLDPKTNSVELFLISDELFTLEIEHREAILKSELSKFDDFNCSKVVLS